MTAPGHISDAPASSLPSEFLPQLPPEPQQAAPSSEALSAALRTVAPSVGPRSAAPSVGVLHRVFRGRPVLRRVSFVVGYEALSVLFTVFVLSALLGHHGGESMFLAVLLSTVATGWNYIWNTIFEAIERRTAVKGRGAAARAVHAVGYEGGVLVFTIPLVAFMLGVSLIEAVMIEGGLLVFFLAFTVIYTWIFDRVFGLPDSAR